MSESSSGQYVVTVKTAFIAGLILGVLFLGTVGFIYNVARGRDGGSALAGKTNTGTPTVNNPSVQQPTAPQPGGPLAEVTDADHITGAKNAKVTLVEYSDFECPFCERFFPTVKSIMADPKYADSVRLVYRHFPLSFHPQAQPAAEASECAAEQGKFWEFHDKMFANQSSLGVAFFKQTAAELGLNTSKFNDCVDTRKYQQKVTDQYNSGLTAGVQGTPATYVNGVLVEGAVPLQQLQLAIDQALAK